MRQVSCVLIHCKGKRPLIYSKNTTRLTDLVISMTILGYLTRNFIPVGGLGKVNHQVIFNQFQNQSDKSQYHLILINCFKNLVDLVENQSMLEITDTDSKLIKNKILIRIVVFVLSTIRLLCSFILETIDIISSDIIFVFTRLINL